MLEEDPVRTVWHLLMQLLGNAKEGKAKCILDLDNEKFEGEQSLPTQECKQSVPLKKGFAAVATYSNLLLLPLNTKIVCYAGARTGCLESTPEDARVRGCRDSTLKQVTAIVHLICQECI